MTSFSSLGISKNFIKSLKELDIHEPTAVQTSCIPILLDAPTDFVGQAHTGTGKTAAFGLPLLSDINPKDNKIQSVVLAPTRELCQQIAKQFFKFTKYTDKIFVEAVYGGAKIDEQISRLRRPTQVVVATPGRLVDLIEKKAVDLSEVRTVVLDEADEMLSMGFKVDLSKVLENSGTQKNIWLFSATMPEGVQKIVRVYLSPKAKRVEQKQKSKINSSIGHQFVVVDPRDKFKVLLSFLQSQESNRGLIFCNTGIVK